MKFIDRFRNIFSSFRGQLLGIVTLGILGLALTAAITTAWVASAKASRQMVAQGLQLADTLAEQSILALLYASPENAQDPLGTILSFPDTIYAAIYQMDFNLLASLGTEPQDDTVFKQQPSIDEPYVFHETSQAWHIIAPANTAGNDRNKEEDKDVFTNAPSPELLGYVYLVIDKATLRALQYNIFLNNILIALAFALVIIILTNLGIKRLIKPLYQLIEVMDQNNSEGSIIRAELEGPREIINLARGFNTMMVNLEDRDRKLRQYGKHLEAEVQIQTHELIEARDAALSANRHKSEFLANISHELRTPLQGIIGYADLVLEELEYIGADEQAEQVGFILNSSSRLLNLINDILHLSKIESGRMDLKLETIDLDAVIKEAVQTTAPMMSYHNNKFTYVAHNKTTQLVIDKEKFIQVILNLLSNAAKFTTDGNITLSSWLTNEQLSIEVKDSGIGLDANQLQIIFEKFRQGDGSITRRYEGTGLGLAISKSFCELMGGTISVKSVRGEGSTFSIIIPIPIVQDQGWEPTVNGKTETRRFFSLY
ncbi:Signal transduction histidine kinase [Desulfuromusa kysingii]|uniref:histidine kinase n=1 Tax=Desulfuromusa kysingii TaxID=37625 RepID=A0A1H3YJJ7_9BACT|nr:HAMP domain-containing sensor histidine kinase [Desulfuromusa kysingii]SEA11720.1 Signal transduction histidine kinase [Desulfuromusa kysingii]